MKSFHSIAFIVLAVLLASTGVAEAGKRKCAEDYRRFCSLMVIAYLMPASED